MYNICTCKCNVSAVYFRICFDAKTITYSFKLYVNLICFSGGGRGGIGGPPSAFNGGASNRGASAWKKIRTGNGKIWYRLYNFFAHCPIYFKINGYGINLGDDDEGGDDGEDEPPENMVDV